jgi:hypothetical protein
MVAHRGLGVLVLLLGVACKDPAKRSVAACEEFVSTQECGDFDFAAAFPCDSYSTAECDLTDWFDCLAENTTCDTPGAPDSDSGACAELLCE